MPKEKRNNLAIYTLAGSILISSVLVSMNQVNAHSTSATKREFLTLKKCISNLAAEAVLVSNALSDEDSPQRDQFNDLGYFTDGGGITYEWLAEKLEC